MKDRDEELDTLLSQTPYIEDAGFTDALMSRLPRRHPSLRVRSLVLLGSAAASCAAVAAVPGARRFLAEIGIGLFSGSAAGGTNLVAIAALVALLVWGAAAAATSDA
jgi:hypothetical protein